MSKLKMLYSTWYERVQTLYLEDIMKLLGTEAYEHNELYTIMRTKPDVDLDDCSNGKNISDRMLHLIDSLIIHLDESEAEDAIFLIFAPTYRHLEQCYDVLIEEEYDIRVLHSSIDVQYCLDHMNSTISNSSERKILLASAIADSSVTIPGVTCVIDLCRALEVKWDEEKETYSARTKWASQSICDQRRGRTGRTCPGRVFRLLPQRFYINNLDPFDTPDIVHSSCRNEVLQLLSSSSLITSDPSSLLNRCLDPPSDTVVSQAIDYLHDIGACTITHRNNNKRKVTPTEYGILISAFPLEVSESKNIIQGAQIGLLHEIVALKVISSCRPYPIVHHFGDKEANERNLKNFYPFLQSNKYASEVLANLSAYMYWNATWNIEYHREARRRFVILTTNDNFQIDEDEDLAHDGNVWEWSEPMEEKHVAWCKENQINPSSVKAVSDSIDTIMRTLYYAKHEPSFLRCNDTTPSWQKSRDHWKGDNNDDHSEFSMLERVYGKRDAMLLSKALTYLCNKDGDPRNQAGKYALEMGKEDNNSTEEKNYYEDNECTNNMRNKPKKQDLPPACIHFLQGNCIYGDKCKNSHNIFAKRPICIFYNQGYCMKGDNCPFSHTSDDIDDSSDDENYNYSDDTQYEPLMPIASIIPSKELNINSSVSWFTNKSKYLMLLGEGNFSFAKSMHNLNHTVSVASSIESRLITDTINENNYFSNHLFSDVDATRLHTNAFVQSLLTGEIVQSFAWNFPSSMNDKDDVNESLLSGTFLSLASLFDNCSNNIAAANEQIFQFGLTLQRDQFSRWYVHRSALRAGFELLEWSSSNIKEDFPNYVPCMNDGEAIPNIEDARFYLFRYARQ